MQFLEFLLSPGTPRGIRHFGQEQVACVGILRFRFNAKVGSEGQGQESTGWNGK